MAKNKQEPNVQVEYTDAAKEGKLSNIFRFDYQNEQMNIEFGQIKQIQENDFLINVVSSIVIPKDKIEEFVVQAFGYFMELTENKDIELKYFKNPKKQTKAKGKR